MDRPGFGATTDEALLWLMDTLERLEAQQMALSAQLEAALTDLAKDVSDVVALLKMQIPALQATIATLETQVAGLQGDKTALQATIDNLKAQADAMETEILQRIQGVDDTLEAELPPPTP